KRNVVGIDLLFWIVHRVIIRRRILRLRRSAGVATAIARTAAWAELDAISNDLGAVLLLTILIPAAGLHAALNKRTASFLKILRARLCLTSEYHDIVEINRILPIAVPILVSAICGDRERRDLHTARERFEFRVSR